MEKWLAKAINDTKARIKSAQERYQHNFDKLLRKNIEEIKPEDQVYLRVERKNDQNSRHKLAPIVDGP